jgi:SNF2 family DNA or RNA helicase
VLVHKFVCSGTVEEKIDALIDSKQSLSDELLAGGAEINLTEMGNDDIMRLVALDLNATIKE